MLPGAAAAVLEVLATQPLEYYRVRRQMNMRTQWQHVYRGAGTRLLGVVPTRTAFWGVQQAALQADVAPWKKILIGGLASSAVQTAIELPFEHVKTRQMEKAAKLTENIAKGAPFHFARNAGFAVCVAAGRCATQGEADETQALGIVGATAVAVALTQPLDVLKTANQSSAQGVKVHLMTGLMPRMLQCCVAMSIGAASIRAFEWMGS